MPSYTIELHPVVDPAPGDVQAQKEQTYELCNPDQLLRDLAEIEARFPGAEVRGIVLTRRERMELTLTLPEARGSTRPVDEFCSIPLFEWGRK